MTYGERAYAFFSEYVKIPKDWGNTLDADCIKELCKFLLDQAVFASYDDIREYALKEADIILPYSLEVDYAKE